MITDAKVKVKTVAREDVNSSLFEYVIVSTYRIKGLAMPGIQPRRLCIAR
eukprot:m.47490 g.47490  ORF g.47490 m.47490 type:complete len:50 (-) comp15636_c0_seq2:2018-2167(-)